MYCCSTLWLIFCLPELLIACFLSFVWPSVHLLSVCKFSTFSSSSQNHWTSFNQTWHQESLGKVDSNCTNEEPRTLSRGDDNAIANIHVHWCDLNISFSRTTRSISSKHGNRDLYINIYKVYGSPMTQSIVVWGWPKFFQTRQLNEESDTSIMWRTSFRNIQWKSRYINNFYLYTFNIFRLAQPVNQ